MTAAEIKAWLAVVANARLAVAHVVEQGSDVDGIDLYDLRRAGEHLDDAFVAGLEAHGQAVLKEYLTANTNVTAA